MRILVILPTRLGDAVLASGCLAQLLERYPQARFTLAASRLAAPLYGALPGLARIHLMDKRAAGRHWLALWLQTAFTPWSLVVDLRNSALSYLVPTRRRLVVGRADPTRHRVVELADLLGGPPPERLRLWFSDAHHAAAARLLPAESDGPVLAVGPTANWSGKIWPVERFAEAVLALTAPDGPLPGARVAVVAAAHERPLANPLLARLPRTRRLDWIGKAPLPVLAAALTRCALYLGNDSGLMHLAAAAGCPTLGLFGPTNETRYAPWGSHCAVVRTPQSYQDFVTQPDFDPAADRPFMADLEVAAVVAAAGELLQRVEHLRQV